MRGLPLNFWLTFNVDLIVRTAYQMAKTPLLPLFAAGIGGGQLMIGTIVAVSTVTGMVLKPVVGALSDRWGRRAWFFAALLLFAGTPFLYRFVSTPEQLLTLRLFHGTATAIFGPVTLAMIAEMDRANRATRLGWFEMAREGGYLLAPTIAGALLTVMAPEAVFTIVGLLSCAAFVPALLIRFDGPAQTSPRPGLRGILREFAVGFGHTMSRVEMWFGGLLEMSVYCVTYGVKAFLPIFAVQQAGFGVLAAGVFFTVQEAAHIVARPFGGRLGDRFGYLPGIATGMAVIAAALLMLPGVSSGYALLAAAVVSGVGQGLIFPSTIAMVGGSVSATHMGLGMGVFGTLKNLGKVAGPIVVGALLQVGSFAWVLQSLAVFLLAAAVVVLLLHRQRAAALAQGR
jgi:MFS family permease